MIDHIGVSAGSKEEAEIFFKGVLGFKATGEDSIDAELSKTIFGLNGEMEIVEYSNGHFTMEVFISNHENSNILSHVCIKMGGHEQIIERCNEHKLEYTFIDRKDVSKTDLLFIRDFSGNLYEIY